MSTKPPPRDALSAWAKRLPLLMYGLLFIAVGTIMYVFGVLMGVPRGLLGLNAQLLPLNTWIVWRSGVPMVIGIILAAVDLFLLLPGKRRPHDVRSDDIADFGITVALTAYDDEDSIALAVADFRAHPRVVAVIVVSNNSTDATFDRAAAAGALTFNEARQGYGYCVHRCLAEAMRLEASDLIVLCEGDRTFRAYDIEKLLAYAPHADIVNGTRTVQLLLARDTQLQHVHVLWEPVRGEVAGGQACWPKHAHRRRHHV